MELDITQKQTQSLSPQMMQSMEILQMGSQELLEYLEEAVQENPVLEVEEKYDRADEANLLQRKLEWLESTDAQNRYYHQQDTDEDTDVPVSHYGTMDDREENLYYYVSSQLQVLELPADVLKAASFLVESLNANGWLDEDVPALAAAMNRPSSLVERALSVVQSLEPAGVGARNLSECLCLQLARRRPADPLAMTIARDYLDALSKSRYSLIARETGAPQDEVRAACDRIRALNPRPGTGFSARENLTYISPDIIVVSFPDHFELLTNDYFFPALSISTYYTRLLKESDEDEVKVYLTGKVRQAKWLVRSIEQRRSTLMGCAKLYSGSAGALFPPWPGPLSAYVPGRCSRPAWRPRIYREQGCKGQVYPMFSGGLSPELLFFPQPQHLIRFFFRNCFPRLCQGPDKKADRR